MSHRGHRGSHSAGLKGTGVIGWLLFALVLGVLGVLIYGPPKGTNGKDSTEPSAVTSSEPTKTKSPAEPALEPLAQPAGGHAELAGVPEEPPATSPHLFTGNPSRATPSAVDSLNYLMIKPTYALSYNDAKGTPNWVSWQLTLKDVGDAPRKQQFSLDDALPMGFYRVTHRDYSNSGFDRGHLCPHSDRDATTQTSYSTFVMTNIIPQAPSVNQRSWAMLEIYARTLITDGRYTLFTIAGPWGKGGSGSKGEAETIVNGRVTVPAECWKVIVVVPTEAAGDPLRVTADTRVIAIRVPNRQDVETLEWSKFRISPADLEKQTGYRFFTTFRPDVAEALRTKVDSMDIPPPVPPRYGRG